MKDYQIRLAKLLAQEGCLFFAPNLTLKDGRPTPYFVNLGNLRSGRSSLELGACFAQWLQQSPFNGRVDVLVGPSYKGSAIAQACAFALYQLYGQDVAFEYDRKEAKTHGEASGQASMFVTGALKDGARLIVLDDVGTSMATKVEIVDKLKAEATRRGINLDIMGIALAVDREQTQAVYDAQGKARLGVKGTDAWASFEQDYKIPLFCLLGIKDMLRVLYELKEPVQINGRYQPLTRSELAVVDEYLQIYGR